MKTPVVLGREARWAWRTRGREAHGDAGARVQARLKGAWAEAEQGFVVYKAHPCVLPHLVKPG